MRTEGLSYAAAGVDIEAYERALERVKPPRTARKWLSVSARSPDCTRCQAAAI